MHVRVAVDVILKHAIIHSFAGIRRTARTSRLFRVSGSWWVERKERFSGSRRSAGIPRKYRRARSCRRPRLSGSSRAACEWQELHIDIVILLRSVVELRCDFQGRQGPKGFLGPSGECGCDGNTVWHFDLLFALLKPKESYQLLFVNREHKDRQALLDLLHTFHDLELR